MALDESGCFLTISALGHMYLTPSRYPVTYDFRFRWKDALNAVWLAEAGEPLEERLDLVDISALRQGEILYFLALAGPRKEDAVLPTTRVWFPEGLPDDLDKQARGDLYEAMRHLAYCVRYNGAEILRPQAPAPADGGIVTALDMVGAGPGSKDAPETTQGAIMSGAKDW
jgi:hypothetical protein